jgi:phage shock protein PspC (stress-responsive transcriptional regulator)
MVGSYFLGMKDSKSDTSQACRTKRFIRSHGDRKLLGVCGGFARYLNVESTTVRIIFLLAALLTLGLFAVVYFLFAFTIKMEEPEIVS